jgi:hypothetical protein
LQSRITIQGIEAIPHHLQNLLLAVKPCLYFLQAGFSGLMFFQRLKRALENQPGIFSPGTFPIER